MFALFSFLLAAAIVFHQVRLGDWEILSPHAAVTLTALWTLLRPSSVPRFLAMMGAQLAACAIDMPVVVNHWLLLGITNLVLFAIIGVAALRGERWWRDGGEIYRRLAPAVRIEVVLVYAFAAFSKLNGGFFDGDVSCAVAMTDELLTRGPFDLRAGWQHTPAIWGTLLVETAIPLLLAFRRTRIVGLAVGIPFHIVLALAGHVPFSGFAMAFYSLFLPEDVGERFAGARERWSLLDAASARVASIARSRVAFPALAATWLAIAAACLGSEDRVRSVIDPVSTLLFVAYAGVLVGLLGACLLQRRPLTYGPPAFRLAHAVWIVGPLLVVLNGVTPYLGLKTQSAFTMYSNLQTEGDRWNHSILPDETRVFGMQDDPVRVTSASDPELRDAAAEGTRYTYFAFRDWVDEHPDAAVAYEHRGRQLAARGGDLPAPNPVAEKLLLFRDIPPPERNTCRSQRSAGPDQGS